MLPEFHTVRYKTITTPVPGQRYGSPGERLSEMSEFSGQEFSRWNNLGLFRYGSGDLREPWARLEVLLGFVSADRLHRSLDAHLPAQVRPVENQRRSRILGKLPPFAGIVVGVKRESVRPEFLQEHHSGRHVARFV